MDKGSLDKRKFSKWSMLLKYITPEEIQKLETLRNKSVNSTNKTNWTNLENLDIVIDLINFYQNSN